MPLDRDEILLTNLKESLAVYQSALLWSMTAAAAFFLLSLRLGDPTIFQVPVLYGQLAAPAAWAIALALFLLLGGYASSAIRTAESVLEDLGPNDRIRAAILSSPSLATTPNAFYRVGTVLFCPITVLVSFAVELQREWSAPTSNVTIGSWVGLLLFILLVFAPYFSIVQHVWRPFGTRRAEPPASASSPPAAQ